MRINGTKAEALNALYERDMSVAAVAGAVGATEAAVYGAMRLWAVGGQATHQAPRGQQVRRIIKELNRHIRLAKQDQEQAA